MPDRSRLLVQLTHALARLPARDPLPLRLCLAYVKLTESDRGAISLGFTTTERALLCATDELAARFEDAQDLVREGPSLDAFRLGSPISSSSLEDQQRRWPHLANALPEASSRLVHAVPMRQDSSVVGVMTVHRSKPADLAALGDLQFLGDAVGAAIIGAVPFGDGDQQLWTEQDKVSQATGMVVAQLGIVPADAAAVLRAHAFAAEVSVQEVARLVLSRTLDFSTGGGAGS